MDMSLGSEVKFKSSSARANARYPSEKRWQSCVLSIFCALMVDLRNILSDKILWGQDE